MLIPSNLVRQSDVVPMAILDQQIEVIGAGAIGSWTVLALAKMGFTNIRVWDHDKVDDVNLCGQFFGNDNIGEQKSVSLLENVSMFSDTVLEIKDEKWNGQPLSGVVITAVDSMAVRRQVFEYLKGRDFKVKLVIDPRMAIEQALLYTYKPINMDHCEVYQGSLYSDEESVQDRCTGKVTMYTALMIAGLVSRTVKDFLKGDRYAKSVSWNIKNDDLKTFWREA